MKKLATLRTMASVLFTAAAVFGCQAQEQSAPANASGPSASAGGAAPQAATPAPGANCPSNAVNAPDGTVRQAVTPKGQVIYVFAVWDAQCVPRDNAGKCASAQCWQTKDGKVWCAKPLAMCPIKGNRCSGHNHMQTMDRKVVCPDNDCGRAINGCPKKWAVKEVWKCPENGSGKCTASEHVKLKDGSMACSPKADAKASKEIAETGGFPVLADEIVEDGTFIVTAN